MDPHPKEGPIKSLLSVCLSVQQFSIFLRNGSLVFFWFLAQSWIIKILKNWQSPFFQENSFLPKFGQKGAQNGPQKEFFGLFEKFCYVSFLGNNENKHCYWYFTTISDKILGFELWAKMLSANQFAGSSKL